mgnify:CR=1 FL=1
MNSILRQNNTKDLLIELVKTSFKLRYQNSILGVLWVLIKPYSQFIVMYFVWTRIVNQDIPNYSLYLLIGIVTYTFFNELIILGQMSLLERANIILKVNFPRQIAVLSALISAIINLGINFALIFVIFLITGKGYLITVGGILNMLLVISVMTIFALGVSFFTSILTVRLRDLKNVFDLGLFLMYWVTPILFVVNSTVIPSSFSSIVLANPFGIMINQIRAGFGVYGELNIGLTLIYLLVSILIAVLGWLYFSKNVRKVAEYF